MKRIGCLNDSESKILFFAKEYVPLVEIIQKELKGVKTYICTDDLVVGIPSYEELLSRSAEVENVLYRHPAVLEAAVIGVPHEKWGETVKAVVVLKPGAQATEEGIIALCKKNLASYKKPTSVEFVCRRFLIPSSPEKVVCK